MYVARIQSYSESCFARVFILLFFSFSIVSISRGMDLLVYIVAHSGVFFFCAN